MNRASLYTELSENRVECGNCARFCVIAEGAKGFCGTKENRQGTLFSLNYGRCAAMNADPIEKKPLYHFYPGIKTFSLAAAGCNFKCDNCQNFTISQISDRGVPIDGKLLQPERLVEIALKNDCPVIAYTYSEPAVFWDYAHDTAKLAASSGLKNVFVTNGYWSEKALDKMAPYMDGVNVDLKFFNNESYQGICSAQIDPVLNMIRRLKEKNIWVEITTLIIPGLNDSDHELGQIAEFIADLSKEIPWHVTAFHPAYKMPDIPKTPSESLQRARDIGLDAGLLYVYSGHAPENDSGSTFCPKCAALLVRRWGFKVMENRLSNERCPDCSTVIPGVWKKDMF